MNDQKIGAWMAIPFAVNTQALRAIGTVNTVALEPIVTTFLNNAGQALWLGNMLFGAMGLGKRLQMAEIAAQIMIYGAPFYQQANQPSDQRECQALVNSLLNGTAKGPFEIPHSSVNSPNPQHLFDHVNDRMRSMYETLMSSQLLLSYSAFETMAGDLWEAALNTHPTMLVSLRGNYRKTDDDEDVETSNNGQKQGKVLPWQYLEKYKYDLRGSMGTILRDRRFRFTKLGEIQKAYRCAFPADCPVGHKEFWDNRSLKSVSALRNLIVHKAGKIDDEFIKRVKRDPLLAGLKQGQQLTFDGETLQHLLTNFFVFPAKLIRAVDDWLVAHPE